jgi:hypothetical protein
MKVQIKETKDVDVSTVRIIVPIRYGDEEMPFDFPFRNNDTWRVDVDIETGVIKDWKQGVSAELKLKVVDGGCYYVMDAAGETVFEIEEDYVPHGLIPGRWGDYIDLSIDADGRIKNWHTNPSFDDFDND